MKITPHYDNVFGENLARLRKSHGVTRRELANALNINENTLTGYEKAGREPKYDLLVKFADFFNVTVDELVRPLKESITFSIEISNDDNEVEDYGVGVLVEDFEKNNSFSMLKHFVGSLDAMTDMQFFKKYISEQKNFTKLNLHYDSDVINLDLNFKIERKDDNGKIVDNQASRGVLRCLYKNC